MSHHVLPHATPPYAMLGYMTTHHTTTPCYTKLRCATRASLSSTTILAPYLCALNHAVQCYCPLQTSITALSRPPLNKLLNASTSQSAHQFCCTPESVLHTLRPTLHRTLPDYHNFPTHPRYRGSGMTYLLGQHK